VKKAVPAKIGVLGGTFDPIHFGHLRTAEEIGQELGLERVYLIPAASPPHKMHDPVTPFDHRLAMVRLGVRESALLEALDLEGRRAGLSYSSDTLKELRSRFGMNTEIFFLVGNDAFLEIRTWKNCGKLFDYAHFVLIPRAGYTLETLDDFILGLDPSVKKQENKNVYTMPSGNHVIIYESTLMDISGTGIRDMVRRGKSITFLVPEAVRTYISAEGLYKVHEDH
jgi:nicotinate-nucleotide adenylyltransferase